MLKRQNEFCGGETTNCRISLFLTQIGGVIEEEPEGIVMIVLVAAVFLLIYQHIAKIERKMIVYFLENADGQTVLIKSIVDNFFAKLNAHFIRDHEFR